MVLGRHPKKFRLLIRTMATQLIEHENITTTRGKAKHLRPYCEKLIAYSKRAYKGQTSPLNLLKGRVSTEKAYKKLLIQLIPRLKDVKGNYINISRNIRMRRGDNAPMVTISIKGNEKDQYRKKRREEMLERGEIFDKKKYNQGILMGEKTFFEEMIEKNPEQEEFFRKRIDRVEHEQWILMKDKKTPPRYSLLL